MANKVQNKTDTIQMYINVSDKDSRKNFYSNQPISFRVQIEPPICLDPNESWTCGLMECDFREDPEEIFEDMYIYCDAINTSVVNGKYDNLLRVVNKSRIFSQPFFIPVTNIIKRSKPSPKPL